MVIALVRSVLKKVNQFSKTSWKDYAAVQWLALQKPTLISAGVTIPASQRGTVEYRNLFLMLGLENLPSKRWVAYFHCLLPVLTIAPRNNYPLLSVPGTAFGLKEEFCWRFGNIMYRFFCL